MFYENQNVKRLLKYCTINTSNSYSFEERIDISEKFHIDLEIESLILSKIDTLSLILLTGDAGDGKTHIIKKLEGIKKVKNEWEIIPDFSEKSIDEKGVIIDNIKKSILKNSQSMKYIIAANSGVLITSIINDNNNNELYSELINSKKVYIINFSSRNLAIREDNEQDNDTLLYKIVDGFLVKSLNGNLFCDITKCPIYENCAFIKNYEKIKNLKILERIRELLHAVYLMNVHITFRELLSIFSYIITKNKNCSYLQINQSVNDEEILYYNNIFDYNDVINKNDVIVALSQLDISLKDIDSYDKVYSDSISFKSQKRRDFFESEKLGNDPLLKQLPIDYLFEYDNLIKEIKRNEKQNINNKSKNGEELLKDFQLGLAKLTDRKTTNSDFVIYDFAPLVESSVKMKCNIPSENITICLVTSDFDILKWERVFDYYRGYDVNTINCFYYIKNVNESKFPILSISFDLFQAILYAKDNIIIPKNISLINESGLSFFKRSILRILNDRTNVSINWFHKNYVNFNIKKIDNDFDVNKKLFEDTYKFEINIEK